MSERMRKYAGAIYVVCGLGMAYMGGFFMANGLQATSALYTIGAAGVMMGGLLYMYSTGQTVVAQKFLDTLMEIDRSFMLMKGSQNGEEKTAD